MSDELSARVTLAIEASARAAELILSYWQQEGLAVEAKQDDSPVTIADRGAEELLRAEILRAFPGDAVLGEEFGETPGTSGYRWILDPIDGTKSFVAGVPLFGTLVGLEFETAPVAGVCRFPALDEVVYASRGQGTWWQARNGLARHVSVSKASRLEDGLFCFTSVGGWDAIGRSDSFQAMCRSTRLTRGWGDCYGHVMVATGRAEVAVDPVMSPWDAAALVPILQEAGGVFCDWKGNPTAYGGNGISTTPALLPQVLARLNDSARPDAARGRD